MSRGSAGGAAPNGAQPSDTVALLVHDVRNPFFGEVARGAEDAAFESGLGLRLCDTDESADKEARYLKQLEAEDVLGLLVTPAREGLRHLQLIQERGLPVVVIDRPAADGSMCSV